MIPVGADQRTQELVRVVRVSRDTYRSEDIADVRFVPLIGEEGWVGQRRGPRARAPGAAAGALGRGNTGPKPRRRRRIFSVDRKGRSQSVDGAYRLGAHCAAWRSHPRHIRILSDARTHHPRADHREGFSLRGDRGGLAGRRPGRSLCAASSVSAVGMDRVCAVSDLDVAKHRGAGFCELAAQA